MTFKDIATFITALVGVTAAGCAALAQPTASWPDRPVKIIVNFAAGGGTDNATRPYLEP